MEEDPIKPPVKFLSRIKKIFIFVVLPTLIFIAGFLTYLTLTYPTTPALDSTSYLITSFNRPHAKMSQEVIGFLPYWRMDDIKYLQLDLISEVIYFSITAGSDGQFVKVVKNETDPGWRWWNNSDAIKDLIAKTQISGGKFSLTVAMQKNKDLESFLNNKEAQAILISNILSEVSTKHLDGINIDFEYDGTPEESLREKFVEFNQNLSAKFRKESPKTKLSIDMFPLSVRKPRLFDIVKLAPLFDRIIVMSYDFYASTSDIAGPVAPMNGFAEKKYLFDIATAFEDYLKLVPKEKLIMGVPYYGWDWPVEDGKTFMSQTLEGSDKNGFASIISYGRARTFEALKNDQCQWDPEAKSRWCWYMDPETKVDHQVWLEDDQSIGAKYDFINAQDLAGAAIWTLGYDKQYPELWEMIRSKFTTP